MNIARAIEICAAAIDAAYASARAIKYPDKFATEAPFCSPDQIRSRLEWANNWTDAIGFVYEMRLRASENVRLGSLERFVLEWTFELLRQKITEQNLTEDVIVTARAQVAEIARQQRIRG